MAGEIDAQSELGVLFMRSLVRTQLRLSLSIVAALGLIVGGLPVLFMLFPGLSQARVAGMPLAWVVLGFAVYPLFVGLGVVYLRAAARHERAFTDVVEEP